MMTVPPAKDPEEYCILKEVIEASEFHNNCAMNGGVLSSSSSTITIEASEFRDNSVANEGGVLLCFSSTTKISSSNFTKNSSPIGGVIYAADGSKYNNKATF